MAFYSCDELKTVRFLGDAPEMGRTVFLGCHDDLTVFYLPIREGFTAPEWRGYRSSPWIFSGDYIDGGMVVSRHGHCVFRCSCCSCGD